MLNSIKDLDDQMVYAVLGGAIFGASASQLLLGQVNSLPIAMGMAGGYIFYGTDPGAKKNRGIGAAYSSG